MRQSPIKQIVIFGYATIGEALEIANQTSEETVVGMVHIAKGFDIAKVPVAYMVLPAGPYFNRLSPIDIDKGKS